MFKLNFYLKIIISFLAMIAIAATYNYYVFWITLALLFLINFIFKCKKNLVIDFILLILIIVSYKYFILIYFFRLLICFNIIITFIELLDTKEKKYIKLLYKKKNNNYKELFFQNNYEKILNRNIEKANSIYDVEVGNEDKIVKDLDRLYLQSKIRFNGYMDKKEESIKFEWKIIDTIVLILIFILFVLAIIFR